MGRALLDARYVSSDCTVACADGEDLQAVFGNTLRDVKLEAIDAEKDLAKVTLDGRKPGARKVLRTRYY